MTDNTTPSDDLFERVHDAMMRGFGDTGDMVQDIIRLAVRLRRELDDALKSDESPEAARED